MFKNPDLFELDLPTRQAIYQAAQTDLDYNHNLSWRDSILNHAEREFKSRLAGYISHLHHKSEQDSATVLGQARRIASLLDRVSELAEENKELANLLASAPPAPQTSVVDDNSPSDLDYSPPGHGVDGFETPSKASVVQQEPLGFVSPKQVERIVDPDGESGAYIPMRKTPAGNFTLPLYTHPAPQQKPLLDEKKIEMWTNATIECCTHMACYMRGIEDAEAAHNIGEKK